MLEALAEVVGALLMLVGTFFCALGVYGVLRLEDVYARLHAAGMVVTLGAVAIMASLVLLAPATAALKGIATALFLLLTGPLITHILARTAHRRGMRLARRDARDDLRRSGEG